MGEKTASFLLFSSPRFSFQTAAIGTINMNSTNKNKNRHKDSRRIGCNPEELAVITCNVQPYSPRSAVTRTQSTQTKAYNQTQAHTTAHRHNCTKTQLHGRQTDGQTDTGAWYTDKHAYKRTDNTTNTHTGGQIKPDT